MGAGSKVLLFWQYVLSGVMEVKNCNNAFSGALLEARRSQSLRCLDYKSILLMKARRLNAKALTEEEARARALSNCTHEAPSQGIREKGLKLELNLEIG